MYLSTMHLPVFHQVDSPFSNVQATSLDVSWNAVTGASSYKVIWGASGFNPATGGTSASPAPTASPYTITGLTGNTLYDVYLIADCGATNGLSDTVGPISPRTACVPENIGYVNGFENDATNATPLCWDNYLTSTNSNTNVITFSGPHAGSQHVQISMGFAGATDTAMLFTPEMANLSSGTIRLDSFHKPII